MIEEPRQALSTSSRKATNLALVPIAMGFMALGAIVAMTLWLNEQARGNFDAVVQARGLGTAAVGLRSALQAAESSQRGFLYAHNEIYLAPYDVSRTQARQQLKH